MTLEEFTLKALVSDNVWVEELDCQKSIQRSPTTKTLEEVLSMANFQDEPYEIRHTDTSDALIVSPKGGPEYFVWIHNTCSSFPAS